MSSSPGPSEHGCEVGIVCALHIEIAPFLERAQHVKKVRGGEFTFYGVRLGEQRIAIVETGVGSKLARQGTHALVDAHAPPWILSAGLSGGLTEQTKRGNLVFANAVSLAEPREVLQLSPPQFPAQPGVHVGQLVTVSQIVRLVSEKQQLHAQTGALAVDMESYHVGQACLEREIPFAALRVIGDDLSADLPPEILGILGPKGTVRAGAVVGALWNRPSCLTDLWKLREQTLEAADQLAKCLIEILKK